MLIPILQNNDLSVFALGRRPAENSIGVSWHFVDLSNKTNDLPALEANTLIHAASLWFLPDWLEKFHALGVRRVIAFSSTSRFTKLASASPYEQEITHKLITAEERVVSECERLGIAWTIFRPTLIYGGAGGDRNVADIARLIRRFGFFPLLGTASGRRQPVHARDLATACVQSLSSPASHNRAYNLSGGEILTYIDMVRRIFETLGRQPRFVRIPLVAFRLAVSLARLHPRLAHLTPDMALRMQVDLVFDHGDATRDFGYRPGRFDPAYLTTLH
ncbi:NAD-dependent epimerase/dehydratase family protein [Polaromonas sp.]|uniref:NAD-dependent epimerase/dehydratase family protein n=1 Tax=Polaromonas sp. TaxID=1869339 RepID=UPI003CB4AC35